MCIRDSFSEGLTIAGNFVPWGRTICLTPEDVVTYEANCLVGECAEGSNCDFLYKNATCNYTAFTLDYTYNNGWSDTVDENFSNNVYYDGELISREVGDSALQRGHLAAKPIVVTTLTSQLLSS
eukprot:6461126-Pyramimonas_sp.AAC.1